MKTLVRERADALLRAWDGFWLSPEPTSALAVVRVAYGLLLLSWALMLASELSSFFSTSGILPRGPDIPWAWSPVDSILRTDSRLPSSGSSLSQPRAWSSAFTPVWLRCWPW